MRDVMAKVATRIRQEGVWRTAAFIFNRLIGQRVILAADRISEAWHEWRLGIETSGRIAPDERGIGDADSKAYEESDYAGLKNVFSSLDIREDRDVFLDMGSGKGRAVIMAATFGFRKVIGVELSPELAVLAERNVGRARKHLRCTQIKLIAANAADYRLPDDVTVVYFFNPFVGKTLIRVFENIRQSLVRSPRRLTVIYHNITQCSAEMSTVTWLRRHAEFSSRKGSGYVVYEATV